jgi:hypothetical protein
MVAGASLARSTPDQRRVAPSPPGDRMAASRLAIATPGQEAAKMGELLVRPGERGAFMRNVTKWAAIVVLALAFSAMITGCKIADPGETRDNDPVGLTLGGGNQVEAGDNLQLEADFEYPPGVSSTPDDNKFDAESLAWTVQPSEGVHISTVPGLGAFVATFSFDKPGVYTITVTGAEGLKTTKTVTVVEEGATATWVQSTTTEAGSATTEAEPTTTETGAVTSFAGTYKGTIPWDMTDAAGKVWGHLDIPWEVTVDAQGNVRGGYDYSQAGLALSLTLTGQVSEDGLVSAAGTSTVTNSYGTNSGTASLNGQISAGGVLTGTLGAADGSSSMQVTATRQ